MTILCDHGHTVTVLGGTYALKPGPNTVPDDVGAWILSNIKGSSAEPKPVTVADPGTNGETIGRARATRP